MTYYIIIRGSLGCGKTTISKGLAKQLKAEYLSIDEIVDSQDKAKDGFISEKSFLKANELIIPRIKDYLDEGKKVIIDGNFYRKSQLDDLIFKLKDYQNYTFTLKAPLKICIERDSKRKNSLGKDAAEVVYSITTKFDYSTVIENKSMKETIKKIVKEINSKII